MRGVAPILLAVVALLIVAAGAYFVMSGSGSAGLSINDIVSQNLGYYCEWEGKVKSLVSFDVYGRYYFHGKKLRFEEKGAAGKTIVVDPDITDPKGTIYQWSVLSEGGEPVMVLSFSKEEKGPETFEEILRIVYTERDRPFIQVLKEALNRAAEAAKSTGIATLTIEKVRCEPWTPNDALFQPPQT